MNINSEPRWVCSLETLLRGWLPVVPGEPQDDDRVARLRRSEGISRYTIAQMMLFVMTTGGFFVKILLFFLIIHFRLCWLLSTKKHQIFKKPPNIQKKYKNTVIL